MSSAKQTGTQNNIVRKTLVCCCCWQFACGVATCYNLWDACEACGFAHINHQACWWALCAPICLQSKLGDTKEASKRCTLCVHFTIQSIALLLVLPIDAIYNCVKYNIANCSKVGVKDFQDLDRNVLWLGRKINSKLHHKTKVKEEDRPEPKMTYKTFKP